MIKDEEIKVRNRIKANVEAGKLFVKECFTNPTCSILCILLILEFAITTGNFIVSSVLITVYKIVGCYMENDRR